MASNDEVQESAENAVRAAARIVTRAAMDALYVDGHQWSKRPCGTCTTITALLGYDFGCVRYAKERASREEHGA